MAIIGLHEKRCQYGLQMFTCGAPATTKRPRPNGSQTWDVCERHATFLDRLRSNIERHGPLLDRLKET